MTQVKPKPAETHTEKRVVRNARLADVDQIIRLVDRAYPGMGTYPAGCIRGQINAFPELFTLQLPSIENEPMQPHEAIKTIAGFFKPHLRVFQ